MLGAPILSMQRHAALQPSIYQNPAATFTKSNRFRRKVRAKEQFLSVFRTDFLNMQIANRLAIS